MKGKNKKIRVRCRLKFIKTWKYCVLSISHGTIYFFFVCKLNCYFPCVKLSLVGSIMRMYVLICIANIVRISICFSFSKVDLTVFEGTILLPVLFSLYSVVLFCCYVTSLVWATMDSNHELNWILCHSKRHNN